MEQFISGLLNPVNLTAAVITLAALLAGVIYAVKELPGGSGLLLAALSPFAGRAARMGVAHA